MFATCRRRAFTLIEVLIVVSIMAVLLTMAAMTAGDMIDSIRMRDAIETVRAQFENARQTASTKNTAVIIRLYGEPTEMGESTAPQWNSLEFGIADLVLDSTDQKYKNPQAPGFELPLKSLGPIQRLPTGYIFHPSASYSTLLGGDSWLKTGSVKGVDGVTREYISFTCLPDQRTNLPANQHWTLTIVTAKDLLVAPTALPANYTTLQLDPTTARIRIYRPE